MLNIISIFLIDFVIAAIAGFLAIRIANHFHLIDQPDLSIHKHHSKPTPLAGGMAILITLVITIIFHRDWLTNKFIGLFIAALVIFIFGIWDDAARLPFSIKLFGQVLAGIVLITSGISVHLFLYPQLEWLNIGITLFWVVGIINGCNFIDSYDNLSIGVIITMLGSLLIGTYIAGQNDLLQLITVLLGTLVVLYFFNTTPAMLFLGDSGSQLLGLFVAAIAILFTPKILPQTISWFAPIIIAGIPIFDTSLVVFSRIRQKKHIYQAGLDHTWHRLVALGLAEHQAVQLIHLFSIVLGCLALLTLVTPRIFSIMIFAGTLLTGFILILYLEKRNPK